MKNFQQQGDVIIKKIKSIPKNAKRINSNILAEGEATGHCHRVIGNAELLELGDKLFMRIMSGNAEVIHEEHGNQIIEPGEYEVGRVLEYDHFLEESREVRD